MANNGGRLADQMARKFFMYVLGQFFLSNGRNYIDSGWLAAFESLDMVGSYDWGSIGYANLLVSLDLACRVQKSLNGPFEILEYWGYEYLGICRPIEPADATKNEWPRTSRWKARKKGVGIHVPRTFLNGLKAEAVVWHPWDSATSLFESEPGSKAVELSHQRVVFTCNYMNVWYLGDRCWRQNTEHFGIQVNPPKKTFRLTNEETNLLRGVGWRDATRFVTYPVSYEKYLAYWRHVTEFKDYALGVEWEIEVYGETGDRLIYKLDPPNPRVAIPPQHQLPYGQAYTVLGDYTNFIQEFRAFFL